MVRPIRTVKVGDLVKLVGSTYFPNAIKPVLAVNRGGFGDVISVDVDCGHPDGKPYAFRIADVELVEPSSAAPADDA